MRLRDVVDNSKIFTDESLKDVDYLNFAQEAVSKINIECNTKFPFIQNMEDDYNAIPEFWFNGLITTYLSYGVKMNDTSLNEADRYLEEFYRNLNKFKEAMGTLVQNYIDSEGEEGLNPAYVEEEGFGGVYGMDTSNAINIGWFNDTNTTGW